MRFLLSAYAKLLKKPRLKFVVYVTEDGEEWLDIFEPDIFHVTSATEVRKGVRPGGGGEVKEVFGGWIRLDQKKVVDWKSGLAGASTEQEERWTEDIKKCVSSYLK